MSDTELWGKPGSTTTTEEFRFQQPPKARWSFSLNGTKEILFLCPSAPNRFHRLMQRLILGVTWRRL